ncbi:MAG: Nif3-like dinuclear metal center hexameric protein [Bacteroidota bacterium]|nr:Nif3-like dinuclear metal center hexameric protein [Bacteroidota bacterium]MDP4234764.1 Nif3-like dinuclear metal center hexameric protein [Bacteroidota bacterium]MDP4244155.1 Nif3-like dinuclear metal center hexameric protein [Bacteroidota bacterium]MDP4289317.1 Nif3-like dinuclear metal center hexameric protein [Bacteroidota bacterium]
MLIPEFLHALEHVVPLSAAGYERDAIGLQVGLAAGTELTGVLFAYEVTSEVIADARERDANLIVAFHPLIFPTIPAVTDATRTGMLIRALIKSDIALYVQHTAFDTHPEFGTSRLMAEALGLKEIRTLSPLMREGLPAGTGMGALGILIEKMNRGALLILTEQTFGAHGLRFNRGGPAQVRTVAMLGGAGMEYYSDARKAGADAFITADIRYHDFYLADHDGILLIDAGHAETERFVTLGMVRAATRAITIVNLHGEIPASRLLAAQAQPNSVRYYHS